MLQDFSNFIATQIKTLITAITVTVMSLLPQTGTTIKPVDTYIASPSATIAASASATPTLKPVIKRVATPKPSPTPTPSPSRISVLLVNDGTTVYCLSEWADEVKRASQGLKDAEEVINKLSDCYNSCSNTFENTWNDCRAKYPNRTDGTSVPELTDCYNKVKAEKDSCVSKCPYPSGGDSALHDLQSNREKSKKFLQETKGEHCLDSK